jgi:hypothetical protein
LNSKTKNIVIITVIAVVGSLTLYFTLSAVNTTNESLTNVFNQPSHDKISKACYDRIKDLQGFDPTEVQMTICVGTVMEGLNK